MIQSATLLLIFDDSFLISTAVVIFFGRGQYNIHNTSAVGSLMFNNSSSGVTFYRPSIADLKAKNTLFISLGDYSYLAFEENFTTGGNNYSSVDRNSATITKECNCGGRTLHI